MLDAVRKIALFSSLDDAELRRVVECGVERRFRKGQVMFHAGDPSAHLYVLVGGAVKLYVVSAEGHELHLGRMEAPDVLGVIGIADGGPRSASAEVVDEATVLVLPRDGLFALFASVPPLLRAYVETLGALLRRLQDRTEDLVFLDLHGRVAKLILQFAGTSEDIDLRVTQADMAAMVGGSRPTVNQILKTFEGRGYIALDGRRISVRNRSALERLAGS